MLNGFNIKDEKTTSKKMPLYHTPQCGACGLYKNSHSPYMQVDGEGKRKILICGEASGENEDLQGHPFVGATGQLLEKTLAEFDVDMRRDCWIVNALRCRPWHWNSEKTKKINRPPTSQEISYCRPYTTGNGNLYGDIAKLNPDVIILLGGAAVTSVIGWLWKEDPGGINKWAGWRIPCQKPRCWICPTWHPSYVAREEKTTILSLMWKKHLEAALSLRGKPWGKGLPNYQDNVQVINMPRQAAHMIQTIMDMKLATAFDFETSTLKPDGSHAEIICCSLSNGAITIAYPWTGEAVEATKKFLRSNIPKIAAAEKFERRWSKARLGIDVRNVVWDTMLVAHLLDNRPDICGLEFQEFVLLGQASHKGHVKPYFQSKGPNLPNRLTRWIKDESALRTLLVYCGLDSLVELEIAKVQEKLMGLNVLTQEESC